jgi:hypothetical protein
MMRLNRPIFIEIPRIGRDNLADSLAVLQGCWKCGSMLWMQSNGFPVLPGLILDSWTHETEAAVSRFCRERNFPEFLLRIEKPGDRWTRRRGGYTIPLDKVRSQVDELASEGMITILLEPASPYEDLYSLTSACDLQTGKVDVEVVGPGFDASDILRSDVLPHERFELFLGDRELKTPALPQLQIKRSHLVGREDHKASFQRRLVKIGARLRNPSFPDEVMSAATTGPDQATLVQEAIHFLQTSGQTTMLDHEEYEPIPSRLLNIFLGEFLRLLERVKASKIHWRTLSLASSFLPHDRLVIWDFYSPEDYDTTVLSRV